VGPTSHSTLTTTQAGGPAPPLPSVPCSLCSRPRRAPILLPPPATASGVPDKRGLLVYFLSSVGPAPRFTWCPPGALRGAATAGQCHRREPRPSQLPAPHRPPLRGNARAKLCLHGAWARTGSSLQAAPLPLTSSMPPSSVSTSMGSLTAATDGPNP
jgi:hypothetical protein